MKPMKVYLYHTLKLTQVGSSAISLGHLLGHTRFHSSYTSTEFIICCWCCLSL